MPVPVAKKILFDSAALRDFSTRVLLKAGASAEDAAIAADVLLAADMRGVESHGIIRLFPYYYQRLKDGLVNPAPSMRTISETAAALALDADNGLGQPSGYRAMQRCIAKAQESGLAVVTVRNSNHYGIAGYYAMLALSHNMIGLSFTNAGSLVAPTYGRTAVLGTNPIAVAAPSGEERPYVLDMATSIVPLGKITVFQRAGLEIPHGWGIDGAGQVTTDPQKVFPGGALLPLGGTPEMRGYKGYGLALLVEILCGILAGAAFGTNVDPDEKRLVSNIGHCFMAIQIDAFRPLFDYQRDMDALIRQLKDAPKAAGQERIYIHGEKEFERTERSLREGVPILAGVVRSLVSEGEAAGVPFNLDPLGEIEEIEI
ncbi:MAG: Ldh family oxidoreductase [Anaerolineaceae bacterium]|nr:Ldh family oxidoreductase [Anaerolineaceae bacterium]